MAAFGGLDDDDEDDDADLLGGDEEEGEEGSGSQVSLPSIPWHTCPEQCGMRSPYGQLFPSTLPPERQFLSSLLKNSNAESVSRHDSPEVFCLSGICVCPGDTS